MDLNLNLQKLKLVGLKVRFRGLFYFCCKSTISQTVVIFFEMVMYADDTTLYCNIDSCHTSSTMINNELKRFTGGLRQTNLH